MSKLFEKAKSTINEHIKNIYKDGELLESETLTKFGNSEFADKPTNYYNLDMIISVCYRVNSQNGIAFRKWATKIVKDYMLKGYAINQKRLDYLEKTIKLIDIANRIDERLENNNAKEILKVIGDYSKALDLLDDYDHRTLKKIKGTTDDRMNGLESIINNIYQSFGGQDMYNSTQEKASNFMYLLVKNHVFIEGNKRIAATLFIYFLNYYGILYKEDRQVIDNNTLTALTLLIAESNPKEKDIIIDLVMNFLND